MIKLSNPIDPVGKFPAGIELLFHEVSTDSLCPNFIRLGVDFIHYPLFRLAPPHGSGGAPFLCVDGLFGSGPWRMRWR